MAAMNWRRSSNRVSFPWAGYIGRNQPNLRERSVNLQNLHLFCWVIAIAMVIGCEKPKPPQPAVKAGSQYPPHWWAPVSKEGAPDWEIFPQDAKSGEVILSKRNELGILSN